MSIEIEAKIKVNDHGELRALLLRLSAKKIGGYFENNTFFDTEDHSLLAADKGLRIRRKHDLETKQDEIIVTLKGPRMHGQLKSREETEVTVGDEKQMRLLLQQLAYRIVLTFEKRRESWMLDGCHVELDELPHLGTFVEIEGPSEEKVMQVRERLGLASHPLTRASYIAMLMSHLQEEGQSGREVRFGAASIPKPLSS